MKIMISQADYVFMLIIPRIQTSGTSRLPVMDTQWIKADCEGGACPEAGFVGDHVYIRDSERPDEIVMLTKEGWRQLHTIKAPQGWL